jgi:hypothetical protein
MNNETLGYSVSRHQGIANVPMRQFGCSFLTHEKGAEVISVLLKKGSISRDDYTALTGYEIGVKLLEASIFALQFNSRRVMFQSTMTMRCCEEMTHWWKYTG